MDVSSESDSYADDGSELAENQHTGSASDDEELIEEDPSGPHHFSSSTSAHTDADRGVAVRQQLGLWDSLLETRIKLQKPLSTSNVLPKPNKFDSFVKSADERTRQEISGVQADLKTVMKELVDFQRKLDFGGSRNPMVDDDEDEGLDSNENQTRDEPLDKLAEDLQKPDCSLLTIDNYLEQQHRNLATYRDTTLELWHSKTQQVSIGTRKNFSAFELSPVKQIQQILGDKNRLLQRTKIKRSTYTILGSETMVPVAEVGADGLSQEDSEIFDDDDFYHQLLREFIERKTGHSDDPFELSRQQIQLGRTRKRTKKAVDSKATRDRKIKFDVHPKLVSFMAPQHVCLVTEQARNDLYKSLFGKLQRGGIP